MTYNPQWKKGFSFGTVAVSGQSNIVADADPDTLTVVAGTNVTLTTDATADALTINATGGGGGITALTGDVTASGTGSVAATIAADAVTNAKLADMPSGTIKGNNTGGAANPLDLTASQVKTLLAIAAGDVSGLGTLATQNGTFSGTSSGTNTGDQTITLTTDVTGSGTGSFAATIASGAVTLGKMANLAANSIIGNNTGSPATPIALTAAQAKALLAIAAADVSGLGTLATQSGTFSGTSSGTNTGDQTITLTGNVTGSGTGSFAATIANDAVTYAKLQNVAANSFLANATGSPADVQEIATTRIPLFAGAITGTPSGTTYLRGDGTWATPSGGADPTGYTTIVKALFTDVTNAGLTNDPDFIFSVTAGLRYMVSMDLAISGSDTTGDFTMDFRVDAGTQRGKGTCQNLTAAAAVANVIVTAAGVQSTTAIVTGAPTANLDDVVFVRVGYAFTASNTTTFRFRFGNAAASPGRISRVWGGSIMRYKALT